jgi:hypothetical protein
MMALNVNTRGTKPLQLERSPDEGIECDHSRHEPTHLEEAQMRTQHMITRGPKPLIRKEAQMRALYVITDGLRPLIRRKHT